MRSADSLRKWEVLSPSTGRWVEATIDQIEKDDVVRYIESSRSGSPIYSLPFLVTEQVRFDAVRVTIHPSAQHLGVEVYHSDHDKDVNTLTSVPVPKGYSLAGVDFQMRTPNGWVDYVLGLIKPGSIIRYKPTSPTDRPDACWVNEDRSLTALSERELKHICPKCGADTIVKNDVVLMCVNWQHPRVVDAYNIGGRRSCDYSLIGG